MKRFISPLLVLLAQGTIFADPVQDVLDASPRLDAPGPGYPGKQKLFVPLEPQVKASLGSAWPDPTPAINPWNEPFRVAEAEAKIENPAIDYPTFAKNVGTVGSLREKRRISEEEFLRMAAEPDTIILDARSHDKYIGVHVKGAVNLPLPDMNVEDLARVIPSKTTRVLIYCNNNFVDLSAPKPVATVTNEPASKPAAPPKPASTPAQKPYADKGFVVFRKGGDGAILLKSKTAPASLNIYTFNSLFAYGYTNVYELGPLIEIQNSILPFEGTRVLPNK